MEIPPSAVTIYPKGTPVPTPTVEVQVLETRVDLSNDMTGRDMLAVGVARNVVLARGMLDKLEGPKYAERRAELRRKAREAARARALGVQLSASHPGPGSKRSADDSGVSERGRGER